MTPERAAELAQELVESNGDLWMAAIINTILQACAEQREQDAKLVRDWPMPTNGRLALEIAKAIREGK